MGAGIDWASYAAITKYYGIAHKMLRNWAAKNPANVRKDERAQNCTVYLRVSAINAAFEDRSIFEM